MNRRFLARAFLALGLATAAASISAADACRPVRTLGAGSILAIDAQQTDLGPALRAVLDSDQVLVDAPGRFRLGPQSKQVTLDVPMVVRVPSLTADLVDDRATLSFDAASTGPALVSREGRRYLVQFAKGVPMDARGVAFKVRPLLTEPSVVTIAKGATYRLTDDGKGAVLSKGANVTWQLGDNTQFRFSLVDPTPLEETTGPAVTDAGISVIKPSRLLPGSVMKVQVRASGYDFKAHPITFCFAVAPEGGRGLYTLSAPGRLISESTEGGLFEVDVPARMAAAVYKAAPGREAEEVGSAYEWLGMRSSVRVMGLDGDKVVFDAAQPFIVSHFWISFVSGFALILVLMGMSAIFLREPNPRLLLRRLAQHPSQRFSLSNIQILMWTLLVLYALAFVWVANGMLLDISSGVLILLGISGGTSILVRGVENIGNTTMTPVTDTPKLKDLITNEKGDFDLLRFQMLGFTLFTLAYSFISVIRSEGLPDIPANLYLLMGISNGAYVGGKIADNMKPAGDAAVAASKTATNDFEKSLSVADIQSIQRSLSVATSGELDQATRDAIARYKLGHGLIPADSSLNELLRDRLQADSVPQ
jgi:hypothetical protein